MKLRNFLLVLLAVVSFGFGRQVLQNLPITTNLLSADASGAITDIQSDGAGYYFNGVDGITSFLTTNGYNGIVWGDWQFDALSSLNRKVSIAFTSPIQVADGGTAVPNPPFTINSVNAHIEDKCTAISYDMITMSAGQSFPCPAIVHFFNTDGNEYRIYMAPDWTQPATPETTFVEVTCNAVASDGSKDWFVDPIPAGYDASGNPIPGAAVGRLVYFGCPSCPRTNGGGKTTDDGNRGDYHFKFHFHLTRP